MVGGLIAVLGTAVIFGNQVSLDVPLLSLAAILAAAFVYSEALIIVKRHPPGDPLAAGAIGILLGAAMLIGLSVVSSASS